MNVKTNIGKQFFKILKKHFPKSSAFYKIFNKNTVKLSYSCMRNVASIISSKNKTLLKPDNSNTYSCNCKDKSTCPLPNQCLTPNIVYKAEVENDINNEVKTYIGLTETPFKTRYANHKQSFRHKKHQNSTELSKYIWKLKDKNAIPSIQWSILKVIKSNVKSNYCRLCLTEKLLLINHLDDNNLLNKRNEFVSKCRHQNKFLLKNVKDSMD